MPFNPTPSGSGDDWKPSEHIGNLVIWEAYEYAPEIRTQFGVLPGARVLVTVVEGNRDEIGQTFDTMFFNASLVRQAKRCLDKGKFLGRLGEQEFRNGTGVTMEQPSEADIATAERFEKWMAEGGPEAGGSGGGSSSGGASGDGPPAPPKPAASGARSGGGTYTDETPPF